MAKNRPFIMAVRPNLDFSLRAVPTKSSYLYPMIIYSVTVAIEHRSSAEWLQWMQTKHIPDVMATGFFEGFSIRKLIDPEPEPGSQNFNIQYTCRDMATLEKYQQTAAPALQEEHAERYKERFFAFRTILEEL